MTVLQLAAAALVLLNLAFVHVTAAVGLHWLVPMYALTCMAPFTVRWREHRAWRGAWNVAVIAIFGLLMHDFVTTGPRHLLEGGLTLAAFCQVHLLNVLRPKQRPDLLFFNSFLIALVTSFFCQDLVYSAIFAAYALVFLLGLQLAAASRSSDLRPQEMQLLARDGARRAVVALLVTGLVFAFWPRDFRRPGLIDDDRWLEKLTGTTASGFAEEVRLGRSARTTVDDRVVLRIQPLGGDADLVPMHWRGATMSWVDRYGWRRAPGSAIGLLDALRTPWQPEGPRRFVRESNGEPRGRARVFADSAPAGRLFAPRASQVVELGSTVTPETVLPLADGTLRHHIGRGSVRGHLCDVTFGDEDSVRDQILDRRRLVQVERADPVVVPPTVRVLIEEIRRGLPADAPVALVVERCRALLATRFAYVLPGEQDAASDLSDFLAGKGGGHCELFATALAVMLRLQDIPCRLVSGYLVHEWDERRGEFLVRSRDAHAWVEWWDEARGRFVTADATPAGRGASNGDDTSWFGATIGAVRDLWEMLTRFDARDRAALIAWLADLPARLVGAAQRHPSSALAVAGLLAAAWIARLEHRRRRRDAVVVYESALARAGFSLRPGETPRELLARAQSVLREDRLRALVEATESHERSRFA